jgi:hypothetical protein
MSMHTCLEDGCDQRASDRCFECGVWRCMSHLVAISLPTFGGYFAETLCSECLHNHLTHPDPYGHVIIQSAPTSVPSAID